MNFLVKIGTLCCLLVIFSGCAAHRDKNRWSLEVATTELERGVSSKKQIYTTLGPPASILYPAEMSRPFSQNDFIITPPETTAEFWTYLRTEKQNSFYLNPEPIEYRSWVMTLYFDQSGILIDYVLRETLR